MNTQKILSSLLIGALWTTHLLEASSRNAAAAAFSARRAERGRGVLPAAGGVVAPAPALVAAPVRADVPAAEVVGGVAELAALRVQIARLIAENNELRGRVAGVVPVAVPHGGDELRAEVARLQAENAQLRAARDRAGGGRWGEALAAAAVGLVGGAAVRAYGDNAALNARVAAAEGALAAAQERAADLERRLAAAPNPVAVAADLAVERANVAALTAQLAAARAAVAAAPGAPAAAGGAGVAPSPAAAVELAAARARIDQLTAQLAAAVAAAPVAPAAAGGAGVARGPGVRDANPDAGIPQSTVVFNALTDEEKARLRGIITFLRGKNAALTPAHEPYALYDEQVITAFNDFKDLIVNWDVWEMARMGVAPRDTVLGMSLEGDVSFRIKNLLRGALGVEEENLDTTSAAVRALIRRATAVMAAAHPAAAGGDGAGMAVYDDLWGNAVRQLCKDRGVVPTDAAITRIREMHEGQPVDPRRIPGIVLNDLYELNAIPDDRPVPVLTLGEQAALLAHMKLNALDSAARERARANPKVIRKFKEMVQGLPLIAPHGVGESVRAPVEDRDDAPFVDVQLPDIATATLRSNNRSALLTDLINLYVRIKAEGRPAGGAAGGAGATGDGGHGGLMGALRGAGGAGGAGLRKAQFTDDEKAAAVAALMIALATLSFISEDQRARVAQALVDVATDRAFVDSYRAADRRDESIRNKVILIRECWKTLTQRDDELHTIENLIMMCTQKEIFDSFNAMRFNENISTKGVFLQARIAAADRIAAGRAGGGVAAKAALVAAPAAAVVADTGSVPATVAGTGRSPAQTEFAVAEQRLRMARLMNEVVAGRDILPADYTSLTDWWNAAGNRSALDSDEGKAWLNQRVVINYIFGLGTRRTDRPRLDQAKMKQLKSLITPENMDYVTSQRPAAAATPPGVGGGAVATGSPARAGGGAAAAAAGLPARGPASAARPAPSTPGSEPAGGAGRGEARGLSGLERTVEEERNIRAFKR